MKKTRAHQRYEVQGMKGVSAKIAPSAIVELLTLGVGGCSFWLNERESSKVKIGELIDCKIGFFNKDELSFKAEVLYTYAFPKNGQLGKCIGVKFNEDHSQIQALLENLQILESSEKSQRA